MLMPILAIYNGMVDFHVVFSVIYDRFTPPNSWLRVSDCLVEKACEAEFEEGNRGQHASLFYIVTKFK